MKPKTFMIIAGEASGDWLAAELVLALRHALSAEDLTPTNDLQPLTTGLEPRFFGAGGPRMAAAGVDLEYDMTAHSIIGLMEAVKSYPKFRRLFKRLFELAREREPDAIICVDFSGFNRRFAQAVKKYSRARSGWFHDWQPRLIQYVSPQVWASRPARAYQMARDYDLLLTTFGFESAWYAKRVPKLRVQFVGHPLVDRYGSEFGSRKLTGPTQVPSVILLLPGSRPGELRRHLPVLIEAGKRIATERPAKFRMVLPSEALAAQARTAAGALTGLEIQVGGLQEALAAADLAVTKSGTITLECACFGVPAVVFYKTSFFTYQLGKQIVSVKYIAMPNLLANEEIFPEFIQNTATPENLAAAALELLRNADRRTQLQSKMAEVAAGLGKPGASERAAQAILRVLAA
jgi:lipid-A-disaccharide synthase